MNKTNPNNLNEKDRERLTILYCAALEDGNFDVTDKILNYAVADSELEKMIFGIEAEMLEEDGGREMLESLLLDLKKTRVKNLAEQSLPSGVLDSDAEDFATLPPLTVRTIFARLQEDATLKAAVRREVADAQRQMRTGDAELPVDLSVRGIEKLLRSVGVGLGEAAQKFFRQAAVLLKMSRETDEIQLAATRKQRGGGGTARRKKTTEDEK